MSLQATGPAPGSAEGIHAIKTSAVRLQRQFDGVFSIETIERFPDGLV
jgi:hypothetical protein